MPADKKIKKRFKKISNEVSGVTSSTVLVDKETGVQYLFVKSGSSAGLTALVDKNGKPLLAK